MALQLILGSSGQGKTAYLMDEVIRKSMEHPSQQYYILVPEQFSLEMQHQMVEKHPRHGFSNIDVLSFYRLAYRVFDECGYQPKEILEDLGVSMVLKKVLLEHEEELSFFRRSMDYPDFVDELKSIIFEFMNYGIVPSDLSSICADMNAHPGLEEKCRELSKIFSWFTESIEERYMVPGQILDVLKDMVPESNMLKEGTFYLDGYTGFTPIQLEFLKGLLFYAKDVVITVTIPYVPGGRKNMPKEDVFSFSEKTIYSLWEICRESHTEQKEPILLQNDQPPRYGTHKELAHIEANLFRTNSESLEEKLQDIHVVSCGNPEEEAEYVLHKIEELVRKKGYRYRDFAILMGNEDDYPSAFLRQSGGLKIPIFLDTKKKMMYHSGVETIRSLFHLAQMDYSYESVFRYLKSGLSDLSKEDIDFLENYVIYAGIRGSSMWKKPFDRRLYAYEEEQIKLLESLREKVLEETLLFVEEMLRDDTTVREKMTVFYEVLCALHLPQKMKQKGKKAEEASEFAKAKGYELFFGEILSLMDKMVHIFGEEVLSFREMTELFDAGLDNLSLSSPPLSMDQVILGDLKRTRLPEIKVLFFVGMNDGDIPPVPGEQGLLSDEEKRILEDKGMTLSLNLTERVLENEYYMYLAFSKPQDALYLSYSQNAADGSTKRPSSLFHTFQKMFPSLEFHTYGKEEKRKYFNEKDSREYLIRELRKYYEGRQEEDNPSLDALLRYWQEEHPEELQKMYDRMEKGVSWMPLSKEVAEQLYGQELIGSVTRLEQFAACPYQYFCTYGLHLTEREEYKIRPMDIGNIFHKALEHFSNYVKEEGYSWKKIPEEEQKRLLQKSVETAIDEGKGIRDVMESSARNQYKKNMVMRILTRTVEILQYHLKNSSFEPDRFEYHFNPKDFMESTKLTLADGHKMAFQGIIDRVDVCEEEDRLYIKIIDYKSGTKEFDFTQLYYGLQLQLVLYLNAAMELYGKEKQKQVEPAGIFYYNIKDPIQKEEDARGEDRWKTFRMSGYANSDPRILQLLEDGGGDKTSFKLSLKKDGNPKKGSQVMETEDFFQVGDYVRNSIKEIGERIYSGEIAAHPYKLGKSTACDYCPYRSVCGFDEGNPKHGYQTLQKQSKEEILEKIREEME